MPVYLDNAATTRVRPEAVRAVTQALSEQFGNPSAGYGPGRQAAAGLEESRVAIAAALGCAPEELYFTSGGTESNNWAVSLAAALGRRKGTHILTTAIEHAAVLEPVLALEAAGWEVTRLKPDRQGRLSPDAVAAAVRPDTALVSVMLVNNEVGTLCPLPEISRVVRASGSAALVHTDAVQGFLKVPFTPAQLGVDLLTVSGHKVGAPKGIGALYIRKGLRPVPLLRGGGQERGLRSGTEPTAQIAGFAAACSLGQTQLEQERAAIAALKTEALSLLTQALPELAVISPGDAPHICSVSLPGYPSEMLLRELGDRGICVSAGSACHKGKPSHVLAAMGLPKRVAMGALRVSFSHENGLQDVLALRDALVEITKTRIAMR